MTNVEAHKWQTSDNMFTFSTFRCLELCLSCWLANVFLGQGRAEHENQLLSAWHSSSIPSTDRTHPSCNSN